MIKKPISSLFAVGLFFTIPLGAMQAPSDTPKELSQATRKLNEKLSQAVKVLNTTMLQDALNEGVDINALSADPWRMTVLHKFVATEEPFTDEQRAFLKALLQSPKIDVNIPSATGETPLHTAVKNSNLFAVQELLDNGANINAQSVDPSKMTVLHMLVDTKEPFTSEQRAFFKKLVKSPRININIPSATGETALHIAAKNGNLFAVDELLENHADVKLKDLQGRTPLHTAAYGGNLEIVEKLTKDDLKGDVNIPSANGETALHIAAKKGNDSVAKKLLDKGADVKIVDSQGRTPLHAAAYGGNAELIKLLLAKDANHKVKDKKGNTPLHIVVERGMSNDPSIVKDLVETDEDLKATNATGDTPLHIASEKDYRYVEALIKEIIAKHDSPAFKEVLSTPDAKGRNALHRAILINTDPRIIEFLLKSGIDPNLPDKEGRTALHYLALAMMEYEEQLKRPIPGRLQEQVWGMKPAPKLSIQEELKPFKKVEALLLNYKADPTITDKEGRTPAEFAESEREI